MTRLTRKTLIEDAGRAGLVVKVEGSRTRIAAIHASVFVYEDGTIHRADTALHLCNKMRVVDAYRLLLPKFEIE